MSKYRRSSDDGGCLVALIYLALAIIIVIIGGWCFEYSLQTVFGKDIPFWADMIGGILTGEFILPVTFLIWVLDYTGILQFPL